MTKWQNRRGEDIAEALGSDPFRGLTRKEAERRSAEKKNILFPHSRQDGLYLGKRIFLTFLPILLFITALAALMTEETVAGYLLLGALVFSLAVLFFAYRKAGAVMTDAATLGRPAVKTLRDGKLTVLPCEAIVEGDVILLSRGDFVPADCRLLQSDGLVMREGGITTRDLVEKYADRPASGEDILESPNMIFAGTCVHRGSCRALVCLVGEETHFATVLEKQDDGFDKMPLMVKLRKLSAVLTAGLLALVFAFTLIGFIPAIHLDFLSAFVLACAMAAATMAEFYGVFAYITAGNAVYSAKNGGKGALFQRLAALEDAAAIDRVLVTPELFKLPDGERLILADPFHGEVRAGESLTTALTHLLRDGALALGEWYGAIPLAKGNASDSDRYQRAVKAYRTAGGVVFEGADAEARYPFLGYGVTAEGERYGLVLCGDTPVLTVLAPIERLLDYSGYIYNVEKTYPLTKESGRLAAENGAALARCGETALRRVFAVAVAIADELPDGGIDDEFVYKTLQGGIVIEGFFIFEETLHAESLAALKKAREKGIAISLMGKREELPLYEKLGFSYEETASLEKGKDSLHIDLTRLEKLNLLRASRAAGEKTAFCGADLSELAHMKEATLSASLGNRLESGAAFPESSEAANRFSDALRLSADLTVPYPTEGSGGFAALWEALSRAGSFFYNMRALLCYLATTFGVKLVLTLVSLFAPAPFVSAEVLALSGLVYDLGAVIALGLRHLPHTERSLSADGILRALPIPLVTGVLAGIYVSVFSLLATPSSLFVPAALLAVSLTTLLLQYLTDRVRPVGFGVIFLAASLALLTAFILMGTADMLWLLPAVALSFTRLLDGVRIGRGRKEKRMAKKSKKT